MAYRKLVEGLFYKPRAEKVAAGATAAMIAQEERLLGVKLPKAYKAAIRVQNGGTLRRGFIKLAKKPPRSECPSTKYSFGRLLGVGIPFWSLAEQTKIGVSGGGLAAGLVPLDGDGHWWACLDYRKCGPKGEPAITYYAGEDGVVEFEIATSFDALLERLYYDPETRDEAVIALDPGAPKGAKLNAILKRLGLKSAPTPRGSNAPLVTVFTWSKYRGREREFGAKVRLQLNCPNEASRPVTARRPRKHELLRVYALLKDENAMLSELLDALGPKAVLIEQAEDGMQEHGSTRQKSAR